MTTLGGLVATKLAQWEREALLFCARHGAAGGLFDVYSWANGQLMAEPVLPGREAMVNQCIPLESLNELRRNGWKVII